MVSFSFLLLHPITFPSACLSRKQAGDAPPQLAETSLKVTERRRRLKLEEEDAVLCCKATEGNEAWKRSAEPDGPRCGLGMFLLSIYLWPTQFTILPLSLLLLPLSMACHATAWWLIRQHVSAIHNYVVKQLARQ